MRLLERDALMAQLQVQLDAAISGAGRLVFLEGEAGIGKTALLHKLARTQLETLPVWWGACDALDAPPVLGVLDDIASQARGELKALLDAAVPRHRLFTAFLDLMTHRPGLVVLEDLHWADGATLDLLRYAGRRMQRTRSLLVASFRSDELLPTHPLRAVLGDLASTGALRLSPAALSVDGVRALCGESSIDPVALHRRTAGNPFFVTEVLAAGGLWEPGAVPARVGDAVMARVSRLSDAASAMLQAAAIAGSRVEAWLLQAMAGADSDVVEECLATGVLRAQGPAYTFRHELARQAIAQSLTPAAASRLHGLALQALQGPQRRREDLARLVHHAVGAADAATVRQLAPLAARDAASRGAHRQAAAHWAQAAEHAVSATERARCLDEQSAQIQMCGGLEQAIDTRREAAGLWRQLGEHGHAAASMARLALLLVMAGTNDLGEEAMREALDLLPAEPVSQQALQVRGAAAGMRMLALDSEQAIRLIRPVLAAAHPGQDGAITVHGLVTLGSAQIGLGEVAAGASTLQEAVARARQVGNDQLIGMALANLGAGCAEALRFDLAEAALAEGIAFCSERDLDSPRLYQLAWLAQTRLYQGRWEDAQSAADEVLADRRAAPIARIMALISLGRLRARQGAAGVWPVLDEARELAAATGALQRVAPMHAARAEAAWLEARNDVAAQEADAAFTLACSKHHTRHMAELVLWRRRGGATCEVPTACLALAFGLEAQGQWAEAADAWGALSCPYDQARALADGDEAAQRQALAMFNALGARPMAERVGLRLRAAGVRGLPRGPRTSTRQHPAGLTAREVSVLELLASGLRTKDIGQRLSRSPRTIDHHLQTIFGKLDVSSRVEAVAVAQRLGLLAAVAAETTRPPSPDPFHQRAR